MPPRSKRTERIIDTAALIDDLYASMSVRLRNERIAAILFTEDGLDMQYTKRRLKVLRHRGTI